ncbi:MAG: Verru_Chthon cassette protein A [Verrucomicrobiaceae bacterium]|nr:Verru_Chthon cassette protein A [Verrucomicrobiaceae bacterium]
MHTALTSSIRHLKRRKAMALVLVIITVALLSILIIAIFSITRTEYKATQNFVAARSAKQYADFAIAITQAQLQNAQNTSNQASGGDPSTTTNQIIHATQPGMVRVYRANGEFLRAHKLYSSAQMVVASPNNESQIFAQANQVPQDWKSDANKARYVDLNEPVVRPGLSAGSTQSVYFPIIDPRAAYTGSVSSGQNLVAVEGFSYDNQTPAIGGASPVSYNEVVLPSQASGNPDKLRLPMPVEWIYVLQDGTTGALDASNKFISSISGVTPSSTNPIVGRVAFWTDDESSKVNVNTATEPTFFAPPYFYHQRDSKWANFPGTAGEFQRYPGHPATVALSAVLAPGINLDPFDTRVNQNNVVQVKELIYGLLPKVAAGGSRAGTRPFMTDDFSSSNGETAPAVSGDIAAARNERLYASVDELLFQDSGYDTTNGRMAARVELPGQSGRYMFDRDALERSRFFLTAHSRSPEFTTRGLPRIVMWPLPDVPSETSASNKRSTFDNLIALCATLRATGTGSSVANSYIFRRGEPHHPTHDVTGSTGGLGSSAGLQRNSRLLDFLYAQIANMEFPQTGALGGGTSTFGQKYGTQNAAQLAIQFFDYIRSSNLYDGLLARDQDGTPASGLSGTALYNKKDQMDPQRLTYTSQRVTRRATGSLNDGTRTGVGSDLLTDDAGVLPGHGQVSPARWTKNGQTFQGFGRMFTFSEIGFQIICTADGKNDDLYFVDCGGTRSGGGCAPKAVTAPRVLGTGTTPASALPPNFGPGNTRMGFNRWYSNFPPLTDTTGRLYGCDPGSPLKHPSRHPGYDPTNWNLTLETNTPLQPTQKRVQVMLMLEAFCAMEGWTKMYPEWAIVLDGQFMRSIQLDGQILFPSTRDVIVKSNGNVYEAYDVYSSGGFAGPTAIAGGRSTRGWGGTQIGDDTDPYVNGASRASSGSRYIENSGNPIAHDGLNSWGLVSNFVTINRAGPMRLTFGQRDMRIRIYDKHSRAGNSGQEVQTINLSFDNMTLPVPALAFGGERRLASDPAGTNLGSKLPIHKAEINHYYYVDSFGRDTFRRSLQAPHWWCFNRMGCIGRMAGAVNPGFNGSNGLWSVPPSFVTNFTSSDQQALFGRLDTESRFSTGPGSFDNGGREGISVIPPEALTEYDSAGRPLINNPLKDELGNNWSGSDVIRTYVPAVGDYRLAAARNTVPRTMWMKHPVWQAVESMAPQSQPRTIHSFTTHWAETESGSVLPKFDPNNPNVKPPPAFQPYVRTEHMLGVQFHVSNRVPDLPPADGWSRTANSYGDFDNGIASSRDGPYINKPDEGNYFAAKFGRYSSTKFYRSGYFYEPWHNSDDWRSGVYMTPNRMISSPVMFGSLPTGVWGGGSVSTNAVSTSGVSYDTNQDGKPWQTLLFRPYARSHNRYGRPVAPGHPGDNNPRDHNLLDLFCMPIVEPYAISEPLSVAGRLNLNYQIMPFTHITRATAMHALMKGEFMTAIPANEDVNNAKSYQQVANAAMWGNTGDRFWDEATHRKYWHRPIDVTRTLYQFEQRFHLSATGSNHNLARIRGLFRTPSQICEIHLIPNVSRGPSTGENIGSVGSVSQNTSGSQLQQIMDDFWQNHAPTGDNTRERPYSNIYNRVTTRGNTFRVHMRAQTLRKARSTAADVFDPVKDAVLGEYRGSALIERYIDPTDVNNPIPDYGESANPLALPPLDTFYKFRTLEYKRFSP